MKGYIFWTASPGWHFPAHHCYKGLIRIEKKIQIDLFQEIMFKTLLQRSFFPLVLHHFVEVVTYLLKTEAILKSSEFEYSF